MDKWQDFQLPYYKHRNKAEGQASMYENWQARVHGKEDQSLKPEDYFDIAFEKVHGTMLQPCQLRPLGYPWAH